MPTSSPVLRSAVLAALLQAAPASAAPVMAPPEGADTLTILACAAEGCSDRLFWMQVEPGFEGEPVMVVEALLADDTAMTGAADMAEAFDEHVERARLAVLAGRWAEAEGALDDAEKVLEQWRGAPDNQALFSMWYLRGAATAIEGRSDGAPSFRKAAAVAWNRSVALPEGTEAWADAYYDAVQQQLDQGTGELVITAGATETTYWLDGVELGPAPIRVQAFTGTHRLDASGATRAQQWRADIAIRAGDTTTARARFPGGDDEYWASAALELAIERAWLEPEMADLLARFADRHGLRALRLLRLDPEGDRELDEIEQAVGGGLPVFVASAIWYDPRLRRFSSSAR